MTNPVISERQVIYGENDVRRSHYYWCPGCNCLHSVTIRPDVNDRGAGWTFEGTLERPTYQPSQLTRWEHGEERTPHVCHTFIREGMIQFLSDCTHALANHTVPMVPLPDWFVK